MLNPCDPRQSLSLPTVWSCPSQLKTASFAPGCQKGVTAPMILTNGKSLVTNDAGWHQDFVPMRRWRRPSCVVRVELYFNLQLKPSLRLFQSSSLLGPSCAMGACVV
ncbi:unnamed protein product [Effrenium voratum]|nr:unnamed protein product [Effrenium voratum]